MILTFVTSQELIPIIKSSQNSAHLIYVKGKLIEIPKLKRRNKRFKNNNTPLVRNTINYKPKRGIHEYQTLILSKVKNGKPTLEIHE